MHVDRSCRTRLSGDFRARSSFQTVSTHTNESTRRRLTVTTDSVAAHIATLEENEMGQKSPRRDGTVISKQAGWLLN